MHGDFLPQVALLCDKGPPAAWTERRHISAGTREEALVCCGLLTVLVKHLLSRAYYWDHRITPLGDRSAGDRLF